MADKDKELESATSAAKQYDPKGLEGTSLDGVEPLKTEFTRAAEAQNQEDKPPGRGGSTPDQPQGSEQVRQAGPQNNMPVPPGMREAADRQAHQERMGKDDQQARRQNAIDLIKRAQNGQGQGRDGRVNDGRDL